MPPTMSIQTPLIPVSTVGSNELMKHPFPQPSNYNVFFSFQNLTWCQGWPLSIDGSVVLHLGPLDESVVRPQDLYLCIRPGDSTSQPELSVGWYSIPTGRVTFRSLDPTQITGASLGPLSLEAMLADELPQLLQTLLVGVERVIGRLPIDDLSFPKSNNDTHESLVPSKTHNASPTNAIANHSKWRTSNDCKDNTEVESVRRPIESGLKRRELITKNKMMGTKYALLRAIKSENSSPPSNSPVTTEFNAIEAVADVGFEGGGAMCLGGGLEFPHIDSDEESADEAKQRNCLGKGKETIND